MCTWIHNDVDREDECADTRAYDQEYVPTSTNGSMHNVTTKETTKKPETVSEWRGESKEKKEKKEERERAHRCERRFALRLECAHQQRDSIRDDLMKLVLLLRHVNLSNFILGHLR